MTDHQHTTKRVFVALSGGVDSAVAAMLLQQQGHDVTGVYMENWRRTKHTPHCTTEEDRRDALRVAHHLNIPFRTVNFEREYEERVVEYFYSEYAAGRTPNPDVMCNKEIKFHAFLDWALANGADVIATGHYARVRQTDGGIFELLKGVDPNKDQSYFLHTITQHQLSYALFPIGDMRKQDVREAARCAGLPNAEKPDSQGICFVGPVNIVSLLQQRIPKNPGDVVTQDGTRVGSHRGLAFYTIGQREGLGIGGSGIPYYVAEKRSDTNTLVVAHGNSDAALFRQELVAAQPHWISGAAPGFPLSCQAAIRYRQTPQPAIVTEHEHGMHIRFAEPQRAVTPGQSAVVYDNDVCLGGGVIE